jgi:hypothetical protein
MHVSLITIAVFLFGTYYMIAYPSHVSVPVIVCILSIISSNTKVVFLIFPVLYCTGKIRSSNSCLGSRPSGGVESWKNPLLAPLIELSKFSRIDCN